MVDHNPIIKDLKHYKPLDRFSEKELILLSANTAIAEFESEQIIFEIDSTDHTEYFLKKGTVELTSIDGRVKKIEAGSESAKTAIALLQPRKYTAKALSDCTFYCIKQEIVNALLAELPKQQGVRFSVNDIHSGKESHDIIQSFRTDLASNNVELPSFPDTAFHIRRLIDDPNCTVKDIAEVIINDPAITVKLLKTCNSPLYRTATEITSCEQAVVRLGFNTTKQLVTVFTLRELFKTDSTYLKQKVAELWDHSREVAAISYVLAKMSPGLDPELALLAGLVQDIGAIPVLNYIERYPQYMKVEYKVDAICKELKSEIGSTLLTQWSFQKDLIEVAAHSEDWQYDSKQAHANYIDIALIAQLHSYIGKKHDKLPSLDKVPAFGKIGKGGLTPSQSKEILHESHEQIEEIKSLLAPLPTLK